MDWLQGLTPLDYVMIGVVVAALLVGWARGLVEVLTGFLVFIISSFVAGRYAGMVLGILNRMWNAQEKLAGALERRLNLPPEAQKVPMGAIPFEKAVDWLRVVPIPDAFRQTLAHRIADWSHTAGSQTVADYITNQLAQGILSAVVFIVMIILLSWGLALLARLVSDQIKEIPLVGTANRLLGSLLVGFESAAVIALIVGLVGPTLSMYGGAVMGKALTNAQLSPYFLSLYQWMRAILFGLKDGPFFIT